MIHLLTGPKWASFIGTPDGKTMFVGIYDATYCGVLDHDRPMPQMDGVDPAGSCDVYTLQRDPSFDEFVGKLYIDWGKGTKAWVQRADRQNKVITELRTKFEEEPFPGFLNFIKPLSKLASLPPHWAAILRESRGVYLLTCPKTKEQYVGSARSEGGFWQRWMDYSRDLHGGNVGLKSREPSDYQVSILEVAGTEKTDGEIRALEDRWKKKLASREMGLNRN